MKADEGMALLTTQKKPKGQHGFKLTRSQIGVGALAFVLVYFVFFSGPSSGSKKGTTAINAAKLNGKGGGGAGIKPKADPVPDFVKKNPDLLYIAEKSREMTADIANFWVAHGPDRKHGGFYGTLDRMGKPASPSYKGLIQQSRHLTSMCYLAESLGRSPAIVDAAHHIYNFIRDAFYDASSGNFYYIVSPDGQEKLEPGKQLYANMHAVAALAYYGGVFGSQEAMDMAIKAYQYWHKHTHDEEHGGWDESKDVPKLKSDDARTVKGVDTHLHVLDGLMRLNRVLHDDGIASDIKEVFELFLTHFISKDTGRMITEFSLNWRPLPEALNHVSYGHDFTAMWMLADAGAEMGMLSPDVLKALIRLAEFPMDKAYDRKLGGFFEYGSDDGTVVGRDHTWWVQCQAMLAAWKMYEHTCDTEYLAKLKGTLEFVDKYMWDKQYGEWYWGITEFGEVSDRGTNKGNEWKASVHTARTTVLLERWVTAAPICGSAKKQPEA